jgi:hypothetical protein
MGRRSAHQPFHATLVVHIFLVLVFSSLAYSQGVQPSSYRAPSGMSGFSNSGASLVPPAALGAPTSGYGVLGTETMPLSSGMLGSLLPRIPNLEFGFLYNFGSNLGSGRISGDYVLPLSMGHDAVLFGEAHGEWQDFWTKPTVSFAPAPSFTVTASGTANRVDLSFGGGYRTLRANKTLLGVNAFYDSSRLFDTWYSSGGLGLEMAAIVAGDDAIDLNFNWYGNLFSLDGIINAFRNKGNSFDVETGYSHGLPDRSMDLRLKLVAYQFDIGTPVYGLRGGADLTSRNGMFTLRYEHGQDRINGSYDTIGGFVTVGFQLENVLKGENPFVAPEPVFRSPRDLRRLLGLKVKRNWHQPAASVLARASGASNDCTGTPPPITVVGTGACVPVGGNAGYFLATNVPLTDTICFTKVTVTFSAADPGPQSGSVGLVFDGPPFFTSHVPVSPGDLSVTVFKATNPDWFGAVAGTNYFGLNLTLDAGPAIAWCPSPVTVTWE